MKRTLKEKIQAKKAYEEAMKRYESKDITGARTYLEEALKADPKDTELLNLLGLLHGKNREQGFGVSCLLQFRRV